MFEIAKRIAVEQDENSNHFCIAHSSLSITSFRVGRGTWKRKCFFVQFPLIFFTEIVCNTINYRNFADKFHRGLFCCYLTGFQNKEQFSFGAIVETILRQKTSVPYPELALYKYDCTPQTLQNISDCLYIVGNQPYRYTSWFIQRSL